MALSWNEIKHRALSFSRTWADAAHEDSQAKPFWIAFFEIFGITDKRVDARVSRTIGEPLPLICRHRLQPLPLALLRQRPAVARCSGKNRKFRTKSAHIV